MPDRFDELLAREPFAILDGGLATELERDGCVLDDPLWSAKILLDAPERVLAVHRRFAEAGADILTTASYQATLPGLRARGLDETQARTLLRETVALARAAAGSDTLVAASIGSYGAYLADGSEYRGDYGLDRRALVEFHRSRFDELVAAAPDLLAFETIPSAVEAEAIAELLDTDSGPDKPPRAWVSFSLRADEHEGVEISDGTPLAQAIAPLRGHPRIAAIGCNCVGPAEVLPALELLAGETDRLPLIVYPNSGERWHGRAWAGTRTEPEEFVTLARRWLAAGARVIGGCCRTRPEHIAALARLRSESRDTSTRLT
jgi:homocysteine S-methyltransferase